MEKKTDDQVTVAMVVEAKARFPKLNACSFDKGFHSQENQRELRRLQRAAKYSDRETTYKLAV